MTRQMSAEFIEFIHDEMVGAFLPFDEEVSSSEFRKLELIESAAGRPFQSFGGDELWPTLSQKAAALFHALACNHCFVNGNKRTAVIALDLFPANNGHLLLMDSDELYALAKTTVRANERSIRNLDQLMIDLAQQIEDSSVDINVLRQPEVLARLGDRQASILRHGTRVLSMVTRLMDDPRLTDGWHDPETAV